MNPPNDGGRRAFLMGAGALLASACTSGDNTQSESPPTSEAPQPPTTTTPNIDSEAGQGTDTGSTLDILSSEMFENLPVCVLTPSAAAGPYPSKNPLLRSDLTEGYPGHPLRLGMRVVDQRCQPIPDAIVDIWHTDASGDYSEYRDGGSDKDEGEGTTFCRGAQTSDADGILEFLTIYPGWYPGRTVHIHASVQLGDDSVLTTQLYLDEALTQAVHATGEYAQYGPQDTSWADDGLNDDPLNDGSLITTSPGETLAGSGTLGLINLGVDLS